MGYLIAAVVLVGILCVADLVLTYGVIRRLREHSELLAAGSGSRRPDPALPVGTVVKDFVVTTTDGLVRTRNDFSGDTLVGFFTLSCETCKDELPGFLALAERFAGGRSQVMAVVLEDGLGADEMIEALSPVAQVVRADDPDAEITKAFQVLAFPTFLVVADGGVVKAAQFRTDALLVPLAS